MIAPGDRVLVAVSGGPDSVSLLYILNEIKREYRFDLSIAHVNHMARGRDSDEDARFVEVLGRELGLQTFMERVDVCKEKKNLKTSFQEAARILRYQSLESILKRLGGTWLAVGHTADDQVETVLINLLRGSGLKGLAGMPEKRDAIIRPLIDCFRNEVEAYLDSRQLHYRIDKTNGSGKYLRNRVRRDLIPVLRGFNENISSSLLETARIVRDDDQCLSGQTDRLFPEISSFEAGSQCVALDRERFQAQPPGLQKRLVRQAIALINGDMRRISAKHVDKVIDLFGRYGLGRQIDLPGHLIAVSGAKGVEFKKNPGKAESIQSNKASDVPAMEVKIPGMTELGAVGIKFHTRLLTFCDWRNSGHVPNRAFLDFDKTGAGIKARFFKPGDRFIPLGMKGRKKLKCFFIDEKVPRESRETIPILTTGNDDIIWVYGKRIAEDYRVTEKTKRILLIQGVEAPLFPVTE